MPDERSRIEVPVIVIGGYLGAGKTTLLNHILRNSTERIVVLVNDFGLINIDVELIRSSDTDTITLTNGCICCTMVDGLGVALNTVRAMDPRPAHVVIEASGVADPALIAAYAHDGGLRLDCVVTVLDGETIRARTKDRYVGDIVLRQIAAADILLVTKVDLIDADTLAELRPWLSGIAANRPVIETVHGVAPLQVLLGDGSDSARPVDAGHPSAAAADELFETWSFTTDFPLDTEVLAKVVKAWPDGVVRVKGIVRFTNAAGVPDGRAIMHRVGARTTVTDDGLWTSGPSQLVAIAIRGTVDRAAMDASIATAVSLRN